MPYLSTQTGTRYQCIQWHTVLTRTLLASLAGLFYQHAYLGQPLDSRTIAFSALGPAFTATTTQTLRAHLLRDDGCNNRLNLATIGITILSLKLFSELTNQAHPDAIQNYFSLGAFMTYPCYGQALTPNLYGIETLMQGAVQLTVNKLIAYVLYSAGQILPHLTQKAQ